METDGTQKVSMGLQQLEGTQIGNRLQESIEALSICVDCADELERLGLDDMVAVMRDTALQVTISLLAIVDLLQPQQPPSSEDAIHDLLVV